MRITRIGFDRKTVLVLGAGATRGAAFVKQAQGALPPLDSDFFTQAQRLSTDKPAELVDTLVADVVTTFGSNFALTMEGYLTRLEQLSHVLDDFRFSGRPPANRYRQMRTHFLQVLAALLDESVGRHPTCDYQRRVLDRMSPEDSIFSLNYDWVMDYTLKTYGMGKWNPRIGYGVPAYARGRRGAGTRYWAFENASGPVYPPRSIEVTSGGV